MFALVLGRISLYQVSDGDACIRLFVRSWCHVHPAVGGVKHGGRYGGQNVCPQRIS